MNMLRRVVIEKRALIAPLALALAANIAAYIFVVRPLSIRAASVSQDAAAAVQKVQAAQREYDAAKALVAGTSRAGSELTTFYGKVLPTDQPSARRLTYTALPALARKMNVKFLERRTDVEPPARDAFVGRLKIRTELQGDYQNLRRFIYELESAPEFVIIDDVTLSQNDATKPLTLSIELSAYYRVDGNGN